MDHIVDGLSLPYLVPAPPGGADLVDWARANESSWRPSLARNGGLLFRGFADRGHEGFSRFIEATSTGWATYREPATPRRDVSGHIVTSTEYPADQRIPLHNENSHCTSWPLKIYFYCATAPGRGGQTPLVDCRRVLASLPPAVVEQFSRRKWRYVRRFGGPLGFSWQAVFKTDDRAAVDAYCASNDMECTWHANGRLTVVYVREALRVHPLTGERLWFNHGLFFNAVSLAPEVREFLLETGDEDELPYDTFFGDGGRVPPDVLASLQEAYHANVRQFDWQRGDILMLDNMLVAHGRNPYEGERLILAGLAEPYAPADSPTTVMHAGGGHELV